MNLFLWGFFWGALSAVSFPIGAVIGVNKDPGKATSSFLMAYGGGSLIFALSMDLFGDPLNNAHNSPWLVVLVMVPCALLGCGIFIGIEWLVESGSQVIKDKIKKISSRGGQLYMKVAVEEEADQEEDLLPQEVRNSRTNEEEKEHSKDQVFGIWIGIFLDTIPESIIIGFLTQHGTNIAFIVAVFLSNFPEALASSNNNENSRDKIPDYTTALVFNLCHYWVRVWIKLPVFSGAWGS